MELENRKKGEDSFFSSMMSDSYLDYQQDIYIEDECRDV
jgi:hypothetical protein